MLVAQVMVLVSYNVATEVALRHMKNLYRVCGNVVEQRRKIVQRTECGPGCRHRVHYTDRAAAHDACGALPGGSARCAADPGAFERRAAISAPRPQLVKARAAFDP